MNVGGLRRRLRRGQARARGALVMAKLAVARIGDRGVREQQLVAVRIGSDLFSAMRGRLRKKVTCMPNSLPARIVHPSRDVPPFAAKRRVSCPGRVETAGIAGARDGGIVASAAAARVATRSSGLARKPPLTALPHAVCRVACTAITSLPSPRGSPVDPSPVDPSRRRSASTARVPAAPLPPSAVHGAEQFHAPVERLPVHDVDQDEADHPAETDTDHRGRCH